MSGRRSSSTTSFGAYAWPVDVRLPRQYPSVLPVRVIPHASREGRSRELACQSPVLQAEKLRLPPALLYTISPQGVAIDPQKMEAVTR